MPQGLTVERGTAWVSGYDGGGAPGTRYCRVQRIDLTDGTVLGQVGQVTGAAGPRLPVSCRHGGGVLKDRFGLWLAETTRLWLLDPDSLAVRRVWPLVDPLSGGFLVRDDRGLLGVGDFSRRVGARLTWFDPKSLLASDLIDVTRSQAVRSQPAPRLAQGAVWADFGPGPAGVWFVTSVTRCGALVGPGGMRRGFIPGAEGTDLGPRGALWTVSETAARSYQTDGDRPVVPMLARFDTRGIGSWTRPDCAL